MMRSAWLLAPLLTSGCLLTQSLSGLSGGAAEADAGAVDASSEAAPQPDAGDGGVAAEAEASVPSVPITFVQGNALDTTSSSTLSVPFGGALRAHSAIVVAVAFTPPSLDLKPLTDSLGNAFTVVSGPWIGNGLSHYIAVALDTPAGADTVNLVLSGVPSLAFLYVHEYAGIATSSAFDRASSANGATAAQDGMNSGSVTTTWPRELVFGFAETGTAAPGTGFTARSLYGDNVTEDRVVEAIGSYHATATMVGGSEWSMMVATFKGR